MLWNHHYLDTKYIKVIYQTKLLLSQDIKAFEHMQINVFTSVYKQVKEQEILDYPNRWNSFWQSLTDYGDKKPRVKENEKEHASI